MPKLCEFENCKKVSTYGINCNPIRCANHKEQNMKLASSLCLCGKQAHYNFDGLKPKFCANCKPENSINVKNKKCIFENCNKMPNYNYAHEKNPIYCKNHCLENMIDIKHKRCTYLGCNKIPSFNFENEKKPIYCIAHKINGMINLFKRKCKVENCKITAHFNYENEHTPIYCFAHKETNMINLTSKCCIYPECKTTPNYNFENETSPIYCKLHKKTDMINIRKSKCLHNDCCITASFNYETENKAIYCFEHRLSNMINVKSKMCLHDNCDKQPFYNFEGQQGGLYCVNHKLPNMVNTISYICKAENCGTRGNKNYKGYCTNCFQHLFPTDPLTFQIRSKTKEIAVRDFINSRFEGFQHDKSIWYNETVCDCTTKRRIDHRKLINGTLLCIETDENQHKSYSKTDEEARYNDIFMAFGGKFIFIRFNPDKYKDKNGKSCNPMLVNRLPVLEDEINKQIKRIETGKNTELLEVIELYYDKSI
jgi:hypothetical protein